MENSMIITLDGPAGVGKSTLAKRLAKHLNLSCLDTGAMYRSIGLALGSEVADMSDEQLEQQLASFRFILMRKSGQDVLYFNGKPIGEEIRTERVSRLAAIVGSLPPVRKALQSYQKQIGQATSLVVEGRDMGTVVFPNAEVKIFLDADAEVRANRRFLEQKNKGENVVYEEILKEIVDRDEKDRQRATDPLKPADDAHIVDTSKLDIDGVFDAILEIVKAVPPSYAEKCLQAASKALEKSLFKGNQSTTADKLPGKPQGNNTSADNEYSFSHLSEDGSLAMVAVEHKPNTLRTAMAYGFVRMNKQTIRLLQEKALPKGDVLSVAKVAGIMAAKRTADSIPLCHPLLLSYIDIRFKVGFEGVAIESEVRTAHNTGVEMEALFAVQVAAATIYDMVKAVQKDMVIENVHLLYKSGGKSEYRAPDYKG